MARKVIIDPSISHTLSIIYDYGVAFDGQKTARKFLSGIWRTIRQVCAHPEASPFEQTLVDTDYQLRSAVAHPYFKVLFWFDEQTDQIIVLDVWDTRKDPDELVRHFIRIMKKY